MSNALLPAHHILGPSVAKRSNNCYGWVDAAAKAPPSKPSKYAAEGTLAHQIASEKLQMAVFGIVSEDILDQHGNKINERPFNHKIGTLYYVTKDDSAKVIENGYIPQVELDLFEFRITEEMLNAVDTYVDYCLSLVYTLPKHRWQDCVFIEKRVRIPSEIGDKDPVWALGGTMDFGIHIPYERFEVVDYKHGAGVVVDVYENDQIMSYALGGIMSFLAPEEVNELSEIGCTIVQPRGLGNGISTWNTTPDRLRVFYGQLLGTQHEIVVNKNRTRNAGEWCTFCPAELQCETRLQYIGGGLSISASDLEECKLPVVADFSLDKLVKLVEMKPEIDKFFKAAAEKLEQLTEAGVDTGYTFVPKYGDRKFSDPKLIQKGLANAKLMIDVYEEKLKTPAAIEREIKAINADRKKAGKDLIEFNVDDDTEKPETGVKLVKKKQETLTVETNELKE